VAAQGRNQPCRCGSGRKVKFCCGVTRGPSETDLARAFLAGQAKRAAVTLARFSSDEFSDLHAEMVELPRRESLLQVAVPRLVTPAVEALLQAVEDDDVEAVEDALPAVLATVDTPLERARLAREVIGLRDAGRIPAPVAATALLELGTPSLDALVTAGLVQAAMVTVGAERTPGGLLVVG
jgi:hypothetical protein